MIYTRVPSGKGRLRQRCTGREDFRTMRTRFKIVETSIPISLQFPTPFNQVKVTYSDCLSWVEWFAVADRTANHLVLDDQALLAVREAEIRCRGQKRWINIKTLIAATIEQHHDILLVGEFCTKVAADTSMVLTPGKVHFVSPQK